MTQWTDAELATLRKVIQKAEADPDFTASDVASLRALAEAYRGLQSLGRILKWGMFLLAALAGLITTWDVILGKVREWLGN